MREEEDNWFSKWADELPSPEDLMPLSQSLITPDLAIAFDIPNQHQTLHNHNTPPPALSLPPQSTTHSSQPNSSMEFDSPEFSGSGGTDETARTLKRPRLVWTPQLHKRFVDAVSHLGIKNVVPKTIMQLMSVDGLTRENVASHLQKYRLYLKRMRGISSNGTNSPGGLSASSMDPATDHLFATSPVPAHFLHPGRSNSDHFLPFVPVATAIPPIPVMSHSHSPLQQQFRHIRSSPTTGQFDHHPFMRQSSQQQPPQRLRGQQAHVEDLKSPTVPNGRKVLTLFPIGDV